MRLTASLQKNSFSLEECYLLKRNALLVKECCTLWMKVFVEKDCYSSRESCIFCRINFGYQQFSSCKLKKTLAHSDELSKFWRTWFSWQDNFNIFQLLNMTGTNAPACAPEIRKRSGQKPLPNFPEGKILRQGLSPWPRTQGQIAHKCLDLLLKAKGWIWG